MSRFKAPNLSFFLSDKALGKEILKIIDELNISSSGNLGSVSFDVVTVAAVQLLYKKYASLAEYVKDMNSYVEQAANNRAQLIVFPAYTGMLPFSVAPQFESSAERLLSESKNDFPKAEDIKECISAFSDYAYEIYYTTMSMLAAKYRVYIMAGSTIYYDGDVLRHRAFLFDDTGSLAGFQDKISLTPLERKLEIEAAYEIKVFETSVAPIVLLTGSDVDYYETGKIAKALGAKIIINPNAYIDEYTAVDDAAGLNLRVQENSIYGIKSVIAGDSGLGAVFQGASCFYIPNELAKIKNGILEKAIGGMQPQVLCCKLDIDKLDNIKNSYTADKNPEFMEKYIDRIY